MAHSPRKVVAELTKVWESVVAKGKMVTTESGVKSIQGGVKGVQNNVKNWMDSVPSKVAFQAVLNEQLGKLPKEIPKLPSAEVVAERAKIKVGRMMTNYEEVIGMSEVRKAHARVLAAEAKFIECQDQRRAASKELMEVQNTLVEIRAELDRTPRGDEMYLELIKKEFAAMKQERILRTRFEDFERMEREVFSELSSALRFSHEKERAQNEKTKYWSIVGSIIGAALGILGTTVNNRMKQSHMKQILGETSTQVAAIQETVENLTKKINEGSLTAVEVSRMVASLKEQEEELALQREKLSKSMQESVKALQRVFTAISAYHVEKVPSLLALNPNEEAGVDAGSKTKLLDHHWEVTALLCCVVSVLAYKYL